MRLPSFVAAAVLAVLALGSPTAASGATWKLELRAVEWELAPGLRTQAWTYGGTVPGTPIAARPGEPLEIEVSNRLSVATNIHWHGLVVPADQDGPSVLIRPGETFTYRFTPRESGTYWYHPHLPPVLEQLDRGLAAPFIVSAPEDSKYSADRVLVLDDWLLDARGRRLPGSAFGDMERLGNVETVNGKTGAAIEPIRVVRGQRLKLRFINASTAAEHELRIEGHRFRVTHLDGHALAAAYETDSIRLAPGERVDAELAATGTPGAIYRIASGRPDLGISIPIVYGEGSTAAVPSPFAPSIAAGLGPGAFGPPDFVLRLGSAMGAMMSGAGAMAGMMHGMGGGGMMAGAMSWTINGKSYPATEALDVKVGRLVRMRIHNDDLPVPGGHRMDHPVHLHGTVFQVTSVDGAPPDGVLLKDTVPVPAGGYVDLAFVMTEPGDWMFHCHVIDHEDGGMTTVVRAR